MSYNLKQLKVDNLIGGWKQYHIQGQLASEMTDIMSQLKDMYYEISPEVGRYVGTAEFYGDIQCRGLRIRRKEYEL